MEPLRHVVTTGKSLSYLGGTDIVELRREPFYICRQLRNLLVATRIDHHSETRQYLVRFVPFIYLAPVVGTHKQHKIPVGECFFERIEGVYRI